MKTFAHKFVDYMPERLDPDVLYVSIRFALVSHSCACGCGEEVVTPLAPTEWQLIFNGETVSLYPSIGNWNYKCRSHYWIRENKAVWIPKQEAKAGGTDAECLEREFDEKPMSVTNQLWSKLAGWHRRKMSEC